MHILRPLPALLTLALIACRRTPDTAPHAVSREPASTPLLAAATAPPPAAPSATDDGCPPLTLPPQDAPSAQTRALYKPGDAHLYYYGIGRAIDYVKARQAARVEIEKDEAPVLGGHAVLMMLYANGFGVQRDLDLALTLACKVGGANAEIAGRREHLQAVRAGPEKAPFDVCDDITSGFMQGHCASIESERRDAQRQLERARLTAGLPAPQAEALARLQGAAEAFWSERTNHEVDLSGSGRAAFMLEEETALKDAFQQALARHAKGRLPTGDAAAEAAADTALNVAYKKALAHDWSYGTVNAAGIRSTERKWLAYRDAFVAYGAARFPQVSAQSWRTWLDQERAGQLRALLEL